MRGEYNTLTMIVVLLYVYGSVLVGVNSQLGGTSNGIMIPQFYILRCSLPFFSKKICYSTMRGECNTLIMLVVLLYVYGSVLYFKIFAAIFSIIMFLI